jgi:hypothetical protein
LINLGGVLLCARMKTPNTPAKRTTRTVRSFQPTPDNEKRLAFASRIGVNVSELINEILKDRLDDALTKKTRELQKELEMVRGAGFEPATPTVSR